MAMIQISKIHRLSEKFKLINSWIDAIQAQESLV